MNEPAPKEAHRFSSSVPKLLGISLLLFLLIAALLTYYLYVTDSLPFTKKAQPPKIKVDTPKVTPKKYENPFGQPLEEASPGAEYENPFREESDYKNPFRETEENVTEEEYVNPFKNLGEQ